MGEERCRFAPTTSGPAHPGTLLAALLGWLDARSRGARISLRLEDVDPTRCTKESAADMREALAWLGLDWDGETLQSAERAAHEAALDRLAADGALYTCVCTRSAVKRAGLPAADGGFRYPGTCRERGLPAAGWRGAEGALRLRLPPGRIETPDEGGVDLAQDPLQEMGDPVLLRADGAVAYHLASVVDDQIHRTTRIVRGRDLAVCTGTQRALQDRLGFPTPRYRHHLLLLEERGDKLAKLHGAVGWREIANHLSPAALCGFLARTCGLRDAADATTPAALLADFDWQRVRASDQVVRWTGRDLAHVGEGAEG